MTPVVIEPRYGQKATVVIGLQGRRASTWGRPLLDAVVEADAVYVVPVVVQPEAQEPYLAAARLARSGDRIEQIYDDTDKAITHSETWDNPNLTGLREIEVDGEGNVYVLNVHRLNNSTMLWKYGPTGKVLCRKELEALGVVDPMGLCVSHSSGGLVYLARGLSDPNYLEATRVYGLSPTNLAVEREVRIVGLQHVTGIAEQGQTGILWIVGYSLDWIPERLDPMDLPKYSPCIAAVMPGDVEVASPTGMEGGIVLPMSIIWTGQ